jgi:hypothetical protein
MLHLKPLVHAILEDYALPIDGMHGVSHWARVLEIGLRLAEETGANIDVVQLLPYSTTPDESTKVAMMGMANGVPTWLRKCEANIFHCPTAISICSKLSVPFTPMDLQMPTSRSRPAGMRIGSTWGESG